MARNKTALGVCSKWAADHNYRGAKRKNFLKRCTTELARQKRSGLGYVYQGTHHTWKAKRRGGR